MPDTRIHVDFNGVQEDGRIFALRRHADDPDALDAGSEVQLWYEDGNTALGRVAELGDRGLVSIEVVPGSWQPGTPPMLMPPPVVAMPTGDSGDLGRIGLSNVLALWIGDLRLDFGVGDSGWWADEHTPLELVLIDWATSPLPTAKVWGRPGIVCAWSSGGHSAPAIEEGEPTARRAG